MKKTITAILLSLALAASLTGCAGGSTGAGGGAAGDSGGVKTIKIAHGASEAYHMHQALLVFKDELESTGLYKVEIYPSSQFGNDAEMVESVKTGDLTMAVPPTSFLVDEVPSMALIELPYMFSSREEAVETLKTPWAQKQLDLLENSGLHGLGYMENGLRHITNSKLPIRTPEDLNGLKMRTMQVQAHVEYWNSLGCSAEGSPFAELYTNLSTKVFDAQENPIAHIYAQKFNEVQSYLTLSGHVYTAYVPVTTDEYWDSLSAEEQEIITDAFQVCYDYQMKLVEEEEAAQLEEIGSSTAYPCEVIELTAAEKQEFIDSAQPTLQKYREELGAEVYDELLDAIAGVQ